MKEFDCDTDIEKESEQISRLRVRNLLDYGLVQVTILDDHINTSSLEVVNMRPAKARELAAELIRLADEIEKQ